MEVDTKAEAELLLSADGTEENVDFSHGDVELLLGDDDVNAFANESFETSDTATSDDKLPSETTDSEAENKSKSTPTTHTTTGHEYHQSGHRGRGDRGRGRGYFHRGGPPPGFFPRGGLRPPFPGAIPRFMGRGLPPWAGMRGRPPMGYMRFPRGMMRGMRPPPGGFMPPELGEEEEEDTEMSEKADDGSGNGPKSLMSIKTPKHIKESVKTQIVTPQIMAPLGMGMGPRYHAMRGGIRPPPGAAGGPPPPMPIPPTRPPAPGSVHPSTSRGGKTDHPNKTWVNPNSTRGHPPHTRGSLKRPASSSLSHEGQRPNKLMATSFVPTTQNAPPSSRNNLRQIQVMDEPMQVGRPAQQLIPSHHHKTQNYGSSYSNGRGAKMMATHTPSPSLTTIRTVEAGLPNARRPPPPQQSNSNLRNIPTIGGSSVPTPMQQPRITKAGGSTSRVLITHLPPNMNFARITAMTTACGSVKTLNMAENNSAIVEFANPAGAENFIRSNNRKVIDQCMITVSRLA